MHVRVKPGHDGDEFVRFYYFRTTPKVLRMPPGRVDIRRIDKIPATLSKRLENLARFVARRAESLELRQMPERHRAQRQARDLERG